MRPRGRRMRGVVLELQLMFELERQVDAATLGSVNGVWARHCRVNGGRGRVVLVVVKEVVKLAVQSPRSGLYQVVGIKAQSTELYEFIAATAFVSGPHSTRSNHTVSTQPPRGALNRCTQHCR